MLFEYFSFRNEGVLRKNAEKPKSKVIPRSWLCGFLSNEAVDAIELSLFESEVFPESTCPNIPMFKFNIFEASISLGIFSILSILFFLFFRFFFFCRGFFHDFFLILLIIYSRNYKNKSIDIDIRRQIH